MVMVEETPSRQQLHEHFKVWQSKRYSMSLIVC